MLATIQFLFLNSCVDEYWPDVNKYDDLLVIEGGITNEDPPYTIKISKSSPIDTVKYLPFTGCVLKIFSENGENEVLTETENGVYLTSETGIKGEIGTKYKLSISTPNSKEYESSYEKLIKPVEIDRVYVEVETQGNSDYDHDLIGYQFYVDTKETQQDTNYYLWQMEATYHFQSDYNIRWYYDGRVRPFNPSDSLFNCWSSYKVNNIFTFNTTSLLGNKLEHFPLNFVNTETRQLTKRYSLLVHQFTISKKAFQFWNAIEKQNSESGSLYAHQPYQIRGNVKNINDEDEPVLGYFMVSGVNSKRIFVDKIDAPFYYAKCEINDGNYKAYSEIGWTDPLYYPVYVILYEGNRAVPGQPCADCRQRDGTIVKPDFWED